MKALFIFFVILIWTKCKSTISTDTNLTSIPICSHGSIKPDKINCTNFFICIYDNWRRATCPDKTYFSIYHNFCITDNSFCYNALSTTTTTLTTSTTSTTSTNYPTSITTLRSSCSTGDLKSYPDNCIKFFMCLKGFWIELDCPIGSHFNLEKGFCPPNNNGTCIDNRLITTTSIPNCQEGHLRPNPNNCAQFFICLRNNWKLEKCKMNMYFSQKNNYCVWNDGSCPDIRTTKYPKKCRPGSLMADNINCAKYFICIRSDWKILACPMNMYFDIKYQMCLPDYGKCFK